MDWYPWLRLLHILGAFGFILAHGVSAHVAFKVRSEREPARIAALLDLSSYSLTALYVSLLVLLAAGIAAGFVGDSWGKLWIWISIGLLVVIIAAMYAMASPYYNQLRRALGQKVYGDAKDAPPPEPLPADEVLTMLRSSRPFVVTAIGSVGLLLIIYLMVLKPL